MINKLAAKNFTVFRKADFAFTKGINVVIGSNGAGKSHVLKLAYVAARWSQEMALREKKQIRPDNKDVERRFFALALGDGDVGTKMTEGASAEDIEPIDALDAEVEQSQRYLDAQGGAAKA